MKEEIRKVGEWEENIRKIERYTTGEEIEKGERRE